MARSATGRDAPDPSLGGPIRNIVRTAHKWGGNGTIPLFDKIKRVLLSKHPEVIARAFGGDANKAAAWIKDNWMAMHGHNPTKWRGKGKTTAQQLATELQEDADSDFFAVALSDEDFTIEDLFQEVPLSLFEEGEELFLEDTGDFEERDGLLWTPICRTGTWMRSPLPGGKPLKLTKEHFEQAVDAFNGKAWEYVTIPLTHDDRVDENTGYIQGLEIRDDPTRPGEYRLWGGHKFTEPEIEDKVRRKSIIGRSVLLAIGGHRDTETGKFWPTVLKHVALTNKPWLNGLNDGVLAASQDGSAPVYEIDADADDDGKLLSMAKRIGEVLRDGSRAMVYEDGEVIALESDDEDAEKKHRFVGRYGGKCRTCGKVYRQGNHNGRTVAASDDGEGENSTGDEAPIVILTKGGVGDMGEKKDGEKNGDEAVTLSQEDFQRMVNEAATAAVEAERTKWEERTNQLETRLSQSESDAHVMRVDRQLAKYQDKGVPPVVLTRVREIMLAQQEDGELKLSHTDEEGKTEEVRLSIADAVASVLDSIPEALLEKGQKDLSLAHSAGDPPPSGDDSTDKAKEKADALWDDMHKGEVAHVS
jgi:hypothetical protein